MLNSKGSICSGENGDWINFALEMRCDSTMSRNNELGCSFDCEMYLDGLQQRFACLRWKLSWNWRVKSSRGEKRLWMQSSRIILRSVMLLNFEVMLLHRLSSRNYWISLFKVAEKTSDWKLECSSINFYEPLKLHQTPLAQIIIKHKTTNSITKSTKDYKMPKQQHKVFNKTQNCCH